MEKRMSRSSSVFVDNADQCLEFGRDAVTNCTAVTLALTGNAFQHYRFCQSLEHLINMPETQNIEKVEEK